MTPTLETALRSELDLDEGDKSKVYDDSTGKPIVKGTTVHGNPSIAIGRNLATRGLSDTEIDMLFYNDILQCEEDLEASLPWFAALTINRRVALISLYFNMDLGDVQGFLRGWPNFLSQMAAGQYDAAATNLETSQPWASEVGARAVRLAALIRNG